MLNIQCLGQGQPLVLFHGFGLAAGIWLSLARKLKSQFKLYLVDLPGFGQSALLSWTDFKQQLLAQLPERFTLLAWSLGGLYATRLALESPAAVSLLVNVASSPCFVQDEAWPGIEPRVLQAFHRQMLKNPAQLRQQFVTRQLQGHDFVLHPYETTMLPGLEQGLAVLSGWDLRELMPELSCRSYYVFGAKDEILPIQTMAAMQARYTQIHYAVFEQAGHAPFLSHEEEFISFLNQHTGTY